MTAPSPAAPPPIVVHAFLVCRQVDTSPEGEISLQNVLEIVPVPSFPADIGPLVFVALVRNLPPGPGRYAFRLQPLGRPDKVLTRLPFDVKVLPAHAERQVALQLRLPHVPVKSGGAFEVVLEWGDRDLASNRFVVGLLAPPAAPPAP